MGWIINTILVRPALLGAGPDELLGHLGYERRRRIGEVPFAKASGASIWIGAIGDRIIMSTLFSGRFFEGFYDEPLDDDFTFFRSALFRHFSEVDIAAFSLDSRVDAWGFAVFQSGALIRRLYGHDGVILGDEGSPLSAETAYFANCDRIEVDSEILYKSRSDPRCEPLSVAHHGEGLVWEVWQSYSGYQFNAPELNQIPGSDFWLNDDEEKFGRRKLRG